MVHSICSPNIAPGRDEILQQLERILIDRRFTASGKNAGFLRYVVETTIEGKSEEIKEVVIATEIYGRSTDYDPKTESIVRVEATRLRSKLRSYYEQDGRNDCVRITIPKGSYVPRFERISNEYPPQQQRESDRRTRPFFSSRTWLLSAAAALAITCFGFVRSASHASPRIPDSDAVTAWQEGNEILRQNPHSSVADYGAPITLQRAIERYEFAVAKSPEFAEAWASLAEAYEYAFAYVGRDPMEDSRRAEMGARRAVALNDKLAYGHAMLALVLSCLKWDLSGAEAEYQKAITLNPRNVYAVVEYVDLLRQTGRLDQASNEIRKARALQPAIQVLAVKEAELQLDQKRPDAAIATAKAAVRLGQDYPKAHVVLGMGWEAKGDFERALTEYRKALAIDEYDRHALPAYGYLLGVMGRREEARAIAHRLEDRNTSVRNCAFQVAIVYAGIGEHKRALDWFEHAYRTRQMAVPLAAVEYRFLSLRKYPEFEAILKRLGLHTLS